LFVFLGLNLKKSYKTRSKDISKENDKPEQDREPEQDLSNIEGIIIFYELNS